MMEAPRLNCLLIWVIIAMAAAMAVLLGILARSC